MPLGATGFLLGYAGQGTLQQLVVGGIFVRRVATAWDRACDRCAAGRSRVDGALKQAVERRPNGPLVHEMGDSLKIMASLTAAGLATLAGGCATLAPHENWMPATTVECGDFDLSADPTPRNRACDSVRQVEGRAQYYGDRAQGIANEANGLNILTITSLVATGGFAVFDAHEDNIKAAALLGATGTGLNQALNPAKRVEVYQLAYDRTACLLLGSRVFLRANADTAFRDGPDATARLEQALEDARKSLKVALLQQEVASLRAKGVSIQTADPALGTIASLGGAELELAKLKLDTQVTKLNEEIRKGEAVLELARSGLGAMVRAPDQLIDQIAAIEKDARDGINAIKIDVSKVLDLVTADFDANLKAAQAIAAKKLPPDPQAPGPVISGALPALVAIDALAEAIQDVERLGLKAYSDASKQLSGCAQVKPPAPAGAGAS